MSDEQDRVARLSDLRALESRLVGQLEKRISEEGEKTRRQFTGEIAAEGEKTRRHFDVVGERIESLVKLVTTLR